MKIEIIKDWIADAVKVKVDGNVVGVIYSESVNEIAETITNIIHKITSTEIIVRED